MELTRGKGEALEWRCFSMCNRMTGQLGKMNETQARVGAASGPSGLAKEPEGGTGDVDVAVHPRHGCRPQGRP